MLLAVHAVLVLSGCGEAGEHGSGDGGDEVSSSRDELTATYQAGVAGYTGTTDVNVTSQSGGNGTTTRTASNLLIYNHTGTGAYQAEGFLRFDGLSLPAGSTVTSATLQLTFSNWTTGFTVRGNYLEAAWNASDGAGLGWAYRATGTPWSVPGARGVGTDLVEGKSFVISGFAGTGVEVKTIALDPAVVQSWIDAPATNQGILLFNETAEKVTRVYTSEDTTASHRPTLTIVYSQSGGGGGGDTTAPTANLSSPSSGATLTGGASLSATAADDVGVAGVRFLVDGVAVGTEDTSAPFASSLDTTTLSNGSHSFAARARDAAGNQTVSASVTATVSNGTTTPTPPTPPGGVLYVNRAYGGATSSGTLAQPYKSIQAAVNVVPTGYEIRVAAGTYTENVTVNTSSANPKHIKLLGGYSSDFSARNFTTYLTRIQSPSTSSAVVSVSSGQPPSGTAQYSSILMEGFSISGGSRGISTDLYPNCWGAGCTTPLLTLTVQSCVLESNGSPTGGGGISMGHGTRLLNSVVRKNKGNRGAGISGGGLGVLVENNLIEDNLSYGDHGGGVYMFVSNPVTFRRNIVRRNVIGVGSSYGGWGGGVIFMGDSNASTNTDVVYMSGNVYTENMSGRGNVFIDEGATAYMDHELIYHNYTTGGYAGPTTTSGGGAIYLDPGKIVMTNCTVVDNNHLGHLNGSTIVDDGLSSTPTPNGLRITYDSTVDVRNSIFWGNGGAEFFASPQARVNLAYSVVSNTTVQGGGVVSIGAGTLVNTDPLFADLAGGNLRLRSTVGRYSNETGAWVIDSVNSPAIQAGDPASAYSLEPTPNGNRVNLGYDGNTARASKSN